MTNAPAPSPALVASAEGELPALVNAAILAECDSPRICSVNGRVKEGIRCGPCERKALFAILARPTAAETQRDAAIRERDDWKALAECRRITAEAEADRCEEMNANLAVALARAERLEKALFEIQSRTGMLLHQNSGRWDIKVEHEQRAVNVLHVNQRIAGEALSHPAPAEET